MVTVFAPINIALVKYWGKRDAALNLPITDSISLSARKTGTTTKISISKERRHHIALNEVPITENSEFYRRLAKFLGTMAPHQYFNIYTKSDIPVGAGLASSASGYASVVLGMNQLLEWNFSLPELSVMARQGSGSACRSLWPGLVHWKQGIRMDGRDSHGVPLAPWPELALGVILLNGDPKKVSSREGMSHCQQTSPLYAGWADLVEQDIKQALAAIDAHDFEQLGTVTEHSSHAMHACMRASRPTLDYSLPETYALFAEVKKLRAQGIPVYATQDAGPNVKFLYLEQDYPKIAAYFAGEYQVERL